jgi:hypothetical protein
MLLLMGEDSLFTQLQWTAIADNLNIAIEGPGLLVYRAESWGGASMAVLAVGKTRHPAPWHLRVKLRKDIILSYWPEDIRFSVPCNNIKLSIFSFLVGHTMLYES